MNGGRRSIFFAEACALLVIGIVLGVRWLGPHDLYEKDQPKTIAYTADIVLHGRASLPRDVIYQPATKPPMYNWIGAAAVFVSGDWSEFTLKIPSVLGVLATGGLVYAVAKRRGGTVVGWLAVGIFFTFGSDIRHGSVLRLSYLARPDMLLTAFCTAAWLLFVIAAERPTTRSAFWPAIVAWLCVTAAALTKGPAALFPAIFGLAYAIVSARPTRSIDNEYFVAVLPGDRLRALNRLWLPVGVPILLLGVGGWLFYAARQDAEHVRTVIWGAEVAGRLTETPEGFRKPIYYSVMWFVTKAQPWGAIALFGLLATAWLPRLRRAAGPAALYLVIVLIGLSIPAAKRMDYLLPAFAPAAVLVAAVLADVVRSRVLGAFGLVAVVAITILTIFFSPHRPADFILPAVALAGVLSVLFVERRRPVPLAAVAVVPVMLAVLLGQRHLKRSEEAKHRWSDHAVAFVEDVNRHVGKRESLLVIVRGKHPLPTLLGRHQGSFLTPEMLKAATYVVLPQQPDLPAVVMSKPVPEGFAEVENRPVIRLGLYRDVPLDRLIAAQKACGVWTAVENPYHAPGTVYRDE